MGAFASFAAAETRAYALVANGTWVEAHAAQQTTGAGVALVGSGFCCRVIRPMSHTHPDYGAWTEITDNTQT